MSASPYVSSKPKQLSSVDAPESVAFRLHGGDVPLERVLLHAHLGQSVRRLARLELHLLHLRGELHDGDLLRAEVAVRGDVGAWRVLLPLLILGRCVGRRRRRRRRCRLLLLCCLLFLILVAFGLLLLGLLLKINGRELT